jgi:signal peptidase I
VFARIGVTLLNVLAPGLGLLRIGKWKLAAVAYAGSLLFLIFMNVGPPVTFSLFAVAAVLGLATYPASMGATWIFGATFEHPRRWHSRWQAVVVALLSAFVLSYFLTDEDRVRYHSFYTPADSMAPSLPMGDRFFAYMAAPRELRRGDLVLVRTQDGSTYVKRIAALPGDLIAVKDGIVMLNGQLVRQRLVSTDMVKIGLETTSAKKLEEQFPGETRSHQIYDTGKSIGDDFGPVRVSPGHYFMMGDNRDHSADSRFGPDEWGLDQVRANDILGRPLYHSWGSSKSIGTPIGDKP